MLATSPDRARARRLPAVGVRGRGRGQRPRPRRGPGAPARGDVDAALPARDGGRATGGGVRRGAAVAVAAMLLAGCGAASPDLFEVIRTGQGRHARLDLVVN